MSKFPSSVPEPLTSGTKTFMSGTESHALNQDKQLCESALMEVGVPERRVQEIQRVIDRVRTKWDEILSTVEFASGRESGPDSTIYSPIPIRYVPPEKSTRRDAAVRSSPRAAYCLLPTRAPGHARY